jgi:hypothetical protein
MDENNPKRHRENEIKRRTLVTRKKPKKMEFFLDCLTLEDGIDRLSRNVVNKTTIQRCVKFRKSTDLNEELFYSLFIFGTGPLVFSGAMVYILSCNILVIPDFCYSDPFFLFSGFLEEYVLLP